jgi:hypothetical protein
MAAWVTAARALELIGETVTDADIARAQPVIELYSGTSPDADADHTARTLRALEYAVSYQAAWMATQIDTTARMDVSTLSQDGVSLTPAHEDAQLLAPLAKRWLDRLPWRRSRSVWTGSKPGATRELLEQARENVVYEADDERDGQEWIPLYS